MPNPQKLVPSKLRERESVIRQYHVVPEHNTPYERVLEKSYWSHVANRLNPSDLIQVEPEDGSYWALLLVRNVSSIEVSVVPLVEKHFETEPEELEASDPEYRVKWNGPSDKYIVQRVSDGEKIASGFSKAEANKWIMEHNKSMAA